MRRQNEPKLKWVLDAVRPGQLVDTPTLEQHGVTRKLAYKYIESGWLEPVVRGLYQRPDIGSEASDWRVVIRSLQKIMQYASVIGGRTALEEQGVQHYLSMRSGQAVHLYGSEHPTWLKRLQFSSEFVLHSAKLFESSDEPDTVEVETSAGGLICSTPERAILEMIDELPKQESFHIVDTAFEALASARPRRFEQLLKRCTSVKVKRLFFVFADKHKHAWRQYLSPDDFDLGAGPRALVKDGRFHPRYKISVPPDLLSDEDTARGA